MPADDETPMRENGNDEGRGHEDMALATAGKQEQPVALAACGIEAGRDGHEEPEVDDLAIAALAAGLSDLGTHAVPEGEGEGEDHTQQLPPPPGTNPTMSPRRLGDGGDVDVDVAQETDKRVSERDGAS